MQCLEITDLRNRLIRQEETIIFALIERAQFELNPAIYESGRIPMPDFDGCFSDFLLFRTECLHAMVRRYASPDEHPFFDNLPVPILPHIDYPEVIRETSVNVNDRILSLYKSHILPAICRLGDDGQYGSSATCDVACLQALSMRIHYGKFVAETKYRQDLEAYGRIIRDGDRAAILECLTDADVEARIYRRVERKAATYGRDVDGDVGVYKISPAEIAEIYRKWIIPLTKEVEVDYLLLRLDG